MKRRLKRPIKFVLQMYYIMAIFFGGMAVSSSNNWTELGISILIGLTAIIPAMVLRIEE